jgi:lycopene cyclase-like protein
MSAQPWDGLVLGGGPAALCIAAALADTGLRVALLAPHDPRAPWPNTYGIWGEEVDALGLAHLLEHRWSHTVSYFGQGDPDPGAVANRPTPHGRDYGLFRREALQQHWLSACDRGGVVPLLGRASGWSLVDQGAWTEITTSEGIRHRARLVVDATGHGSALLCRPDEGPVAGQAAYGIVGRFSKPPVAPGQFVLMDYRCDHLEPQERQQPPTFLYAMDLGDGLFFVEETSLALAPPVPYERLKQRLLRRLAHRGVAVTDVQHEEFCLFPMNLPLPDPGQPLLAFGGAASMVHPASGYLVGSLLRRAPALAEALAAALADDTAGSAQLAQAGWQALWPRGLRRRHALYQFGLAKLMRFPEARLRAFFATFFSLPGPLWFGFLTNTLSLPELVGAMLRLFLTAPWGVRWGLLSLRGPEWRLGLRLLRPG